MKVLSQYALENVGEHNIVYFKQGELKKYSGSDAEVIICSRATAREILNYDFSSLKLVQLNSAGFENIDLKGFSDKGVLLCNAGAIYSVCMAETVVFGILQVEKRLRRNPNNRHFKLLRKYSEIGELKGKCAVTLGAGNIAVEVAKRLNAFDVTCYGYDPFCIEKPEFTKIIRTREELKEFLPKADYVVSALPLLKETENFVDADLIAFMKSSATFINVGRMATVDKADLFFALKKKKIAFAVLDMFEKIPNPLTNKFRRLKNAVVLPGVSAISKESRQKLKMFFAAQINKINAGEKPSNIVNGL